MPTRRMPARARADAQRQRTEPHGVSEAHRLAVDEDDLALLAAALQRPGADPAAADDDGETALHWASSQGKAGAASLLAAAAPLTVSARDVDGATPLHHAASPGVVAVLLDSHADPAARDSAGAQPLHWMAGRGLREACGSLLALTGADPSARDDDGETPLHRAAFGGHAAVCALLLACGADPDARGPLGATPLHWAARSGSVSVCCVLASRGADVNAPDFSGEPPVEWAAEVGNDEACVALLLRGARATEAASRRSAPARLWLAGRHPAQLEAAAAAAAADPHLPAVLVDVCRSYLVVPPPRRGKAR